MIPVLYNEKGTYGKGLTLKSFRRQKMRGSKVKERVTSENERIEGYRKSDVTKFTAVGNQRK